MFVKTFFGGKLEIRSLAQVDNPANRSDVQARLISSSGELAVLTDGSISIQHLASLELRSGVPRGNHFHKLRHEQFYLIAGKVEFHAQDLAMEKGETILLNPGDLVLIHPHISHAFLPLSAGWAIEFAPESFDPRDVYRHLLVEHL